MPALRFHLFSPNIILNLYCSSEVNPPPFLVPPVVPLLSLFVPHLQFVHHQIPDV